MWPGSVYSLEIGTLGTEGFAVRRETGLSGLTGSAGDYNWGGPFGTYFWVDPKEEMVVVYMMQAPGAIRVHHRQLLKSLALPAIE